MGHILDLHGNPIEHSKLKEEIAQPLLSGIRSVWHSSVSNGLTPAALATLISSVDENNDITDYLTLAEEMEMRDLHYASVLSTRKNAVTGLEIMVEAASDSADHVKHRDFVAEVIEADTSINLARDLMDAIGKGFSVSEIMWDQSGPLWMPSEYKWRDPHFFQFDHVTRNELRLRDIGDLAEGIPLQPFKFIQHRPHIKSGLPIHGGLARLSVVAYMCKGYTLKDWMAFAEVFGMPLRVGKYGTDASTAQKAALLAAVGSIGSDAAAIIPENMIIEFIESVKATGGERLFEGLANWLDSQTSKGVLGQTMTTDDGSSQSQANVHNDVRGDIKVEDAKQLSMTFRRDLGKPLIDLNFGQQKPTEYPKIRVIIDEPEDLVALSEALPPFIDRGLRVESSFIRDKFSIPEPEDDADVLGSKTAAPSPPPTPEDLDKELQRSQQTAVIEIMGMVRRGEEITGDQRALLATSLAVATRGTEDEVDRLADEEADKWRKLMDPVLQPVIDHAQASSGYEGFLEGLDKVLTNMDSTLLAERLAVSNFKARGLGDAKDKPE